jgi:hypothetical protein
MSLPFDVVFPTADLQRRQPTQLYEAALLTAAMVLHVL